MKTTNSYLKFFADVDKAYNWMRMKNISCKAANNFKDLFVMIDGPENNFAVVDLNTAIDMNVSYEWTY
jgi:hypothetical protein